jgi:lipid-binding SYLF domain-containing protein
MKKNICYLASAALAAFLFGVPANAAEDLQGDSLQAVANFKKTDPDMVTFFNQAAGYAVFPNVGKGGLVVGGARGKGVVYEKERVTGRATMTQASIGAQAGGQTFSEIIFFENSSSLNDFKGGKFELSAEASAVAAAAGASKAANYKKGVAVFTLSKKGLMVQASIGGQKFKFEPEFLQPTGRPEEKPGKTNNVP